MSNIPLAFTQTHHHDVYPAIDPSGVLKGTTKGKSVLLTGAGRGIGKAIALALARSGASTLILTSRNLSQLSEVESEALSISSNDTAREYPIHVIKQVTDVTDEKSVEDLFATLKKEKVGRLDVLINNAGYLENLALFGEQDWTQFRASTDVNVKGIPLLSMLSLRHNLSAISSSPFPSPATVSPLEKKPTPEQYKEAFDGVTIVNTSSVGAFVNLPEMLAYPASKTWVNRFTELLHYEHGISHGLRTFTFHPGGVRTHINRNLSQETHDNYLIDTPELAAGYVVWLLTKEADFLRGKYSSCQWDVVVMMERREEIEKDPDMLMTRLNWGAIQNQQ